MNTDEALKIDVRSFNKLYYYDETSSTGLRYGEGVRRGRGAGYAHRHIGDEAGLKCYMRDGDRHMIRVYFGGRLYPAHRVIWTLECGEIAEGHVIDHIDGNPFNNILSNLRSIPSEENTRNAKKRLDNKTGVTGVIYCRKTTPKSYERFGAIWRERGKKKSKYFSVNEYGYERAFELACRARLEAIQKLELQGVSFSERHGK